MTLALLLFQTASPTPASTQENLPAWLTLVYVSVLAFIVLFLLLSLIRNWLRRSPVALTAPASLSKEIRKRLGATTTNRGLRAWRWLFALAAIGVFGFHVYWARYAPDQNAKFQELSYKDLRNRRLSESSLRGWIYDRKGRPLAYYKKEADGKDKPLLNRALNEYYVPGSTFKTVMMYTAFRNGMQNTRFTTSGGFTPAGCGRTITDDDGGCEACGNIGIDVAYQKSSNIYFSYMGTQLGGEKIRDTAKLLGLGAYDSLTGEGQGRREPEIWNASSNQIKSGIAPTESWLKAGPHSTRCELMYEGYGQGYASQMTPFQMALMISAAANLEGKLMKPKIEADRAPEMFSQVLTREQAGEIRHIMNMVTEGGTGTGAMAPVRAAGIRSGGKTGTAQKAVPVIDPKTGEPMRRVVGDPPPEGRIIRGHRRKR